MSSFSEAIIANITGSMNPESQTERDVTQMGITIWKDQQNTKLVQERTALITKIHGTAEELKLDLINSEWDRQIFNALRGQLEKLT